MKFFSIAFIVLTITSSFATEKAQSVNLLVTEKDLSLVQLM